MQDRDENIIESETPNPIVIGGVITEVLQATYHITEYLQGATEMINHQGEMNYQILKYEMERFHNRTNEMELMKIEQEYTETLKLQTNKRNKFGNVVSFIKRLWKKNDVTSVPLEDKCKLETCNLKTESASTILKTPKLCDKVTDTSDLENVFQQPIQSQEDISAHKSSIQPLIEVPITPENNSVISHAVIPCPPPPPLPGTSNLQFIPPPPPPFAPGLPILTTLPVSPANFRCSLLRNASQTLLRKKPVTPREPMKPLFWKRILVPTASNKFSLHEEDTIWEKLKEEEINDELEFSILFSCRNIKQKKAFSDFAISARETAKIVDSKKSQNIGIILSSLRIHISDIKNAIYNFDTSAVSIEALQQIYEMRATDEEIQKIKSHILRKSGIPLDKPEQFLLDLNKIPYLQEFISCFTFYSEFDDIITSVGSKLQNIKALCKIFEESEELQMLLSIILAFGNYMNGGNPMRGQADGFQLDILAKLKDVKSSNSSTNLLHYIVRYYLKKCEDLEKNICLPIPEPGDVEKATIMSFNDIDNELKQIVKKLKDYENNVMTITSEKPLEISSSFSERMASFIGRAKLSVKEEIENFKDCKSKFSKVLKFYQYSSDGKSKGETMPSEFFLLWLPFCRDFKDLWLREKHIIQKERTMKIKKIQLELNRTNKVVTTKIIPGGLKEKILQKKGIQQLS